MQVIKLASSCTSTRRCVSYKMQVIKLASSTEFATKIWKESNFCTEVIHLKLETLSHSVKSH